MTRLAPALFVLAGAMLALAAHAQDTSTSSSSTSSATVPPPLVDATLDSMQGGQRTLSAERGRRAVVLFYEDRDHLEDNSTFKGDLARFVVDNHLDDRVVMYGVANLADVGMVPQALVRSMIAPLVDRWGSDILLDWEGVMRRDPFAFPTAATTCAIVDRSGAIIYRYTGVIDEPQRRTFYRLLRAAIAH